MSDIANCGYRHTESVGDFGQWRSCFSVTSDYANIVARKLSHAVAFAASQPMTRYGVVGIISECSIAKMTWIATGRIIARMQHPARWQSKEEAERHSMAGLMPPSATALELPISFFVPTSSPRPTSIWTSRLIHEFPKPSGFWEWLFSIGLGRACAATAAKAPLTFPGYARRFLKPSLTQFARIFHIGWSTTPDKVMSNA